jgi:hypothetical protein
MQVRPPDCVYWNFQLNNWWAVAGLTLARKLAGPWCSAIDRINVPFC